MTDPHDLPMRREAMLPELIEAMRSHHRARRRRRRLGLGLGLGLGLVVAGWAWVADSPRATTPPRPTADRGPARDPIVVSHAQRTGLTRIIDDDGLVERLAEINRPAGLIRSEGRAWLTAPVTDAQRGSIPTGGTL